MVTASLGGHTRGMIDLLATEKRRPAPAAPSQVTPEPAVRPKRRGESANRQRAVHLPPVTFNAVQDAIHAQRASCAGDRGLGEVCEFLAQLPITAPAWFEARADSLFTSETCGGSQTRVWKHLHNLTVS